MYAHLVMRNVVYRPLSKNKEDKKDFYERGERKKISLGTVNVD